MSMRGYRCVCWCNQCKSYHMCFISLDERGRDIPCCKKMASFTWSGYWEGLIKEAR